MKDPEQCLAKSESDPSTRPQLFSLRDATEAPFEWVKSRRPSLLRGRTVSYLQKKAQFVTPNMGGSQAETSGNVSTTSLQEEDISPKNASVSNIASAESRKGDKFNPFDLQKEPMLDSGLPPELWTIIQSAPANFTPHYFLEVSRNLLENPNLTASHLARAELSYSSFTDATYNPEATYPHELAGIIKHMRADHQPLMLTGGVRDHILEWTVVRKLIPRNPKLDQPLLQTCHHYSSTTAVVVTSVDGSTSTIEAERYMVIYLPHVSSPDTIPFYHPKVQALAILYTYHPTGSPCSHAGTLSIYYNLFPSYPLDNRLSRTALKMLEIIHKHSRGRQAGYTKRVHHDVIIPQKRFQDTYAYLKGKYAKPLIDNWVEQTPASKHVFEDLGIAAFLIELWTDMYGGQETHSPDAMAIDSESIEIQSESERRQKAQAKFPNFVDIGCGNGLLVYILNQEGWNGWGFDARRRKTWDTFEPKEFYEGKLKEMLLVPEVLNTSTSSTSDANLDIDTTNMGMDGYIDGNVDGDLPSPAIHNGIFPTSTFIISNHADELTAWTPMLAFLSESPFIAIPCCSHNFGGTRFRAPDKSKSKSKSPKDFPDTTSSSIATSASSSAIAPSTPTTDTPPFTLSLQPPKPEPPTPKSHKQPSAYATLCTYISHLTRCIHYIPEIEHLRIPSTRNVAIIGRRKKDPGTCMGNLDDTMGFVREIVEREMGGDVSIEQVRLMWLERGGGLVKGKGKGSGGH